MLCYFTPLRVAPGPRRWFPHDLESSLDAPKSNVACFQPVFIDTIERCFSCRAKLLAPEVLGMSDRILVMHEGDKA
jgi:hypothetical protein